MLRMRAVFACVYDAESRVRYRVVGLGATESSVPGVDAHDVLAAVFGQVGCAAECFEQFGEGILREAEDA